MLHLLVPKPLNLPCHLVLIPLDLPLPQAITPTVLQLHWGLSQMKHCSFSRTGSTSRRSHLERLSSAQSFKNPRSIMASRTNALGYSNHRAIPRWGTARRQSTICARSCWIRSSSQYHQKSEGKSSGKYENSTGFSASSRWSKWVACQDGPECTYECQAVMVWLCGATN